MELALINVNILTMDESKPRAQAVLIRGERIAEVGSIDKVRSEISSRTAIVDLKGRTVLPGFVDSHTHFVAYGLGLSRLDFKDTKSISEALEMIGERVRASEKGELIIGEGWDQSRWREGRYLSKEELDSVAPDNPVVARRVCGHLAVANSEALDLLAKDMPGVDRETGTLSDDLALNLNRLFPPPREELLEGLRLAVKEAHSLGVTSVHDIVSSEYLRAYQEMNERGELRLRVYACFYEDYLDHLIGLGLRTQFGDNLLKLGGIKIFADGSLGAKSAALSSPYEDGGGKVGLLAHSDKDLKRVVEKADHAGMQVLAHAIGDRAIGQVLDSYENVVKGRGNPLRHRIEHMELPTGEHLRRAKDLGIIACMQPNFLGEWGRRGGMYEEVLGEARWRRNNPLREALDSGVRIAFGSDSLPFSPLYGIYWAVNHPVEEQRLTVSEALQFYTLGSAYASFEEEVKGSIEEGKLADLIVLSEDPFGALDIGDIAIELTLLGGEVVHGSLKKELVC